ncbi:hypothetical protein AXA44_47285 [Rhodococcus sp. SC4]|nr:hypothetical protein AXA44_47285 [Rhodococcus sp. SC4]
MVTESALIHTFDVLRFIELCEKLHLLVKRDARSDIREHGLSDGHEDATESIEGEVQCQNSTRKFDDHPCHLRTY